ncbi:MAG: hypothetical protein GY743_17720, partial [Planctomycetaceae bacterium]|nr:hypothetical protein [Planctomycetaceae bacterium]
DARYPVTSYRKLARLRQKAAIPFSRLPLLVTFTDINDPASVVRVDPYDLEKYFGTGVKLKAVTLEIAGEPVTRGEVEKVLGSNFFQRWGTIHKKALGRGLNDQYFDSFLSKLSRGVFIKER